MDSQKISQVQNQLKKSSSFMIFFLILFGFLIISLLISALVCISPFVAFGYIFFLLFNFLKDIYRINRNFKFDKIELNER